MIHTLYLTHAHTTPPLTSHTLTTSLTRPHLSLIFQQPGLNTQPYRQLSADLRSGVISKYRYTDTDFTGGMMGVTPVDLRGFGDQYPRGSESDLVGIGSHSQNPWQQLTRNEYSALSVGAILQNSPGHALIGNTAGGQGAGGAGGANPPAQQGSSGAPQKALPLNQQQLSKAWDVSQRRQDRSWHTLTPPCHTS